MSYSCGIVGLPNAGKSTLFNAVSRSSAPAEDFPFCTIDPNRGRIRVNDPRLTELADLVNPDSVVPLFLPVVDIAGLVQNASKGEGLGNRFLAHIRETDVLLHTVRCFSGGAGDQADPVTGIDIIDTELVLADLETLHRRRDKIARDRKGHKKGAADTGGASMEFIERIVSHLETGASARSATLADEDEQAMMAELGLISAKPVMFICNIDDTDPSQGHDFVQAVREHISGRYGDPSPPVCTICARIEAEIAELPEADQAVFIRELGWSETGLDQIVRRASDLLARLCFFTAGSQEVRAWSAPCGANARTCAGRIHTDFAKGFIAAAVVSFQDFIDSKGWKMAQEKGLVSLEGAGYKVSDGDVINFRFNV